jgi:mannose-1-phosphate guanylyltransferase/phosphomannomutase
LVAFHRASLEVLAGQFAGLVIPGREITPNVRLGSHSKFSVKAVKETPLLIGSRCRIADNAELGGEVVVSNDVVIDRRAVIRSSVIMPNTYIGELVEVTNAIVAGHRLIHVDTGTIATVVDSFLLASIRNADLGIRIGAVLDRVVGAGLFVASLWLWPIALIAAIAANPRRPIGTRLLVGNRRRGAGSIEFNAFEFATSVPLLRYLPYLLAVISGHLRLCGVEPLEAAKAWARSEEWELVRDEGKIGLLGPVQLRALQATPNEQCRIMEAAYVATRSIAQDLKLMLRAIASLASGRAWYIAEPSVGSDLSVTSDVKTTHKATARKFAGNSHRAIEFEPFETIAIVTRESERKRNALKTEQPANSLG